MTNTFIYRCPDCYLIEKRSEQIELKCPSCDDEQMVELERISERELETRFDDWLDEISEPIMIITIEYPLSDVLKSVDPVRHRQEFLNWLDREIQEGRYTDEIDGEHYALL